MSDIETNPRLRRRDLDALDLSPQAVQDVEKLKENRLLLDRHNAAIQELNKERLAIWKRRLKKGDLKKNELARLSGVTPTYISKVLEK